MRLFLASLVFSAVAVTAADRGWLEPRSHQLWVSASASSAGPVRPSVVPRAPEAVFEAAPEPDDAEAELEPPSEAPSPFVVHVESLDVPTADAEPSPTFRVKVACGDKTFEARTNPDEPSAAFANLPDGPCQVAVDEPGWSRGVADVTIGEDLETTVTVSRPVALVVKVVDSHGRAVPGAQLTVTSVDGPPVGELLRRALPHAVVTQTLAEGAAMGPSDLSYPERPPRMPELVFDESENPSGDPREPLAPEVPQPEELPAIDPSWVTLTMPASGTLELAELPEGTFHLAASAPGATEGFRDLTLTAGQREVVALVLEQKASVEVTVSGAADPSAVEVSLTQAGADVAAGTLVAPGRYRFDDVPPGAVDVQVALNGSTVAMKAVLLGEGETKRVDLQVSVGEVEVRVAGLTPDVEELPIHPGRHKRAAYTAVRLDCGEGAELLTWQSALSGSVATFEEVPTGARCRAFLNDRPLAGSAEVVAPGKGQLTVSSNSLELVAPGEKDFLAVTLTGPAGAMSANGTGHAVVHNIAAGRYTVTGRLGDGQAHATIDVTGAPGQRVTLSKARPLCFSVRAVDATSGESISVSLTAYVRGPSGSWDPADGAPVSSDRPGDHACFVGDAVSRVVVSTNGYQTRSFGAGQEDLGEVRLTPHATDSIALADDVALGTDGALVVQGHASGTVGLRTGDVILAIDGRSTANLVWEEISDLLGGERGSALSLSVRRAEGVQELTITRT